MNKEADLKLGEPVENRTPPPVPGNDLVLDGSYVTLLPLSAADHGAGLHAANLHDRDGAIWDYLPYGPFATLDDYDSVGAIG
ncbi:hypothetical protein [Emcibacter nanhaiensis]|uniref:Uncharacterized protein n=1 Tax=Emcibacter nanhaiensis TaxID=1505037 RepID=A0A501PR56_9PROT|nr:hypothetical protein [Emcibacter nanhaiensis]TPD62933.1 hypothetical protein FIV46_02310 [Emcibacter nanhaiensis]